MSADNKDAEAAIETPRLTHVWEDGKIHVSNINSTRTSGDSQ